MLEAGGMCEFTAPAEYRRPASAHVTGLLRVPPIRLLPPSWNHIGGTTLRGAAHAQEPALVSPRSQDGEAEKASSERRAGCPQRASGDGRGQPRASRTSAHQAQAARTAAQVASRL